MNLSLLVAIGIIILTIEAIATIAFILHTSSTKARGGVIIYAVFTGIALAIVAWLSLTNVPEATEPTPEPTHLVTVNNLTGIIYDHSFPDDDHVDVVVNLDVPYKNAIQRFHLLTKDVTTSVNNGSTITLGSYTIEIDDENNIVAIYDSDSPINFSSLPSPEGISFSDNFHHSSKSMV